MLTRYFHAFIMSSPRPVLAVPRVRSRQWLLLGKAMDRAEAPNQPAAIYADHVSIRQMLLKDRHRFPIAIALAKDRHEESAVGEVEIQVGGRHALAVDRHRLWHRQLENIEPATVLVAGLVERAARFLQDREIRIALVGFDADGNRAFVHK